MSKIVHGFEPVYDDESKLLILGSFPSVKSRQVDFYYGNKQNRFWKTISSYFSECVPESVDDKRNFLLRRHIALWDIVTECEIVGSKDDSIKNFSIADLKIVLQNSQIKYIILNGSKAYTIFLQKYKELDIPYVKLPSTSPANTHFDERVWYDSISRTFIDS